MEHHPEVHGDCLPNGEPSSPLTIRFGARATWSSTSDQPIGPTSTRRRALAELAARLILDLDEDDLDPALPVDVARSSPAPRQAIDEAQVPGAKDIVPRVTVNIGVIQGGLKVNIVPGTCWFEADIRVPPGWARTR